MAMTFFSAAITIEEDIALLRLPRIGLKHVSKSLLSTRKYVMLKVRALISCQNTSHAFAMLPAWFVASHVPLRSPLVLNPASKKKHKTELQNKFVGNSRSV
ncbi:hypothetical protein TNIN_400041 [Trichonephila inaurata madagascariensis]|uniref:Uncharacterized protein n=1 Tax=Trichonephila inaurata madagascariensis TaxID=2747483 RepID=A0A8X7CFA6_9ARAC|nr:hypothetical protein TNIN_400041 [Trichonephila inaurata madagascariensis]